MSMPSHDHKLQFLHISFFCCLFYIVACMLDLEKKCSRSRDYLNGRKKVPRVFKSRGYHVMAMQRCVYVCKIEDLFQHYVELLISHKNNMKIKLLTITHGHSPLFNLS